MKKTILTALILFIGMSLCQAQFSAELINADRGNTKIYIVKSDGSRYRYDFEEDGMAGTVIVDPLKEKTAILIPEKKFVHYTEINSGMSLANDPFQSFLSVRKRFNEKFIGREMVNGYECKKSEIYNGEDKILTAWYSDELNFLVKMVNNREEDTYMELLGIKPGKIDPAIFKVPDGYTEVDSRMRPIIPEPPPPDSWNEIEATMPVRGEFKRGDLITFKIIEDKHHNINVINTKADPAKMIWSSIRDGRELPDNEQGPVKWRTIRLLGNETYSNTYGWKPGDIIKIEVHEGSLELEIVTDK